MYYKDFDKWNIEKQSLHNKVEVFIFPKIRHIYYVKFGINIGFESDGKSSFLRPAIVLSKIGSLYWIAPLTTKLKQNIFYHLITSIEFENIENSIIILSQARVIDKKRFQNEIGIIKKDEFKIIQKKMKKLYFPSF